MAAAVAAHIAAIGPDVSPVAVDIPPIGVAVPHVAAHVAAQRSRARAAHPVHPVRAL